MVRDLKKKVLQRTFLNVWTDAPKLIKKPKRFADFEKGIKRKRILEIYRRAKNIIFELSGGCSLLVHPKMTGHFLIGNWSLTDNSWHAEKRGPMKEKVNSYIHMMFWLDKGPMLALSDLRKFAKVELWRTEELKESEYFKSLGPEPLEKEFSFKIFKDIITMTRGKIKPVLMNPKVIAGIGNIYSDEILWRARLHPLRDTRSIKEKELKEIYNNIKKVLVSAIKLRGESISDFRDPQGKKGFFDTERRVYQREGEKCRRCGSIIKRLKVGGRSAHFCPHCQSN